MTDPAPMRRAIELAEGHHPHPNPAVGAVITDRHGSIIGEGFHAGPGQDHAEVMAISGAGPQADGSTMYVTLEPCSHQGRTPPCVEAIIAAGVSHVVVGTVDPDKRVSGAGISSLIDAGVKVTAWDAPLEVEAIDAAYFHHRRTGLPLVTMKYAMTLDGSVAAVDGSSQWITSTEARAEAHRLRSEADALVVGAGTLRRDDPNLDVRMEGYQGPQPRPVVLAGVKPLPEQARLLKRDPLLVTVSAGPMWAGAERIVVEGEQAPDPEATARALADRGYLNLLLEGGPIVASSWWEAGLVSSGVIFVGAKVGGGPGAAPLAGNFPTISDARPVEVTDVRMFGPDVRISFH